MGTKKLLQGAVDISLTASFDTGSLPTGGDDMVCSSIGADVTSGSTALAAVDLLSLTLGPQFNRKYGSAANPMQHVIDQTSTGKLYIQCPGEAAYIAGGTIYEAIVNPLNAGFILFLSCTSNTIMRVLGGSVRIAAACALSQMLITGGNVDVVAHATNTITGGGSVSNGLLTLRRRIASAAIDVKQGGRIVYDVDTTTTTPSCKVEAGATVEVIRGAMTLDLSLGGTLDLRNLAETSYTMIVSTSRKSRILLGRNKPTITETAVDGVGANRISS